MVEVGKVPIAHAQVPGPTSAFGVAHVTSGSFTQHLSWSTFPIPTMHTSPYVSPSHTSAAAVTETSSAKPVPHAASSIGTPEPRALTEPQVSSNLQHLAWSTSPWAPTWHSFVSHTTSAWASTYLRCWRWRWVSVGGRGWRWGYVVAAAAAAAGGGDATLERWV